MKFLLTNLFILIYVFSFGQYTLKGKVLSEDLPVSGAYVILNDGDLVSVTSEDGAFLFDNLSGLYTIRISRLGYVDRELEVGMNDDQTINITIEEDAAFDEVIIKAIRADVDDPFTYTNVDKEELSGRNLGQDIPYLLQYEPSVLTSSDAGAGVGYTYMRVRGSDATRINVTINGIPYNDAESQGTFWVDIPDMASSTQSVQLQRGVGTSTNGSSAFGASLNILTDAVQEDPYLTLASSYGSYNTRKNTLAFSTGLISDHIEFTGRLSDIYSDGYIDRAYTDMQGYSLQAAYRDDRRIIKALSFGGKEKTYQAWFGISPEQLIEDRRQNPYTYENEIDKYRQDHIQFHWNEFVSDHWSANIGLNYTKGKGYFEQYKTKEDPSDFADIPSPDEDEVDVVVRRWLDNDFYVGNASVSYRGDFDFDGGISYSDYIGDHFGEVLWTEVFSEGSTKGDRYYFSDADKKDFSGFAKVSYPVANNIDLYADIQLRNVGYRTDGLTSDRAMIDVDTSYLFFNPKAGITYRLDPSNHIYASYARANREPNRNDFEAGVSDHETLDNIEIGYRSRSPRYNFGINGYYMNYTNQLVLTGEINDVGAPLRESVGKSYRMGVELDGNYRPNKNFNLGANLTLSQNKNKDYKVNFDGGLRDLGDTDISFSPAAIANAFITYTPIKNLDFTLYNKYVSSQYMSNIESEVSKLDAYFINDFLITYDFGKVGIVKDISAKFLVNNLLNKEYVDRGYYYNFDDTWSDPNQVTTIEGVGYYPQATINFLFGVEVKF